MADDVDADVRHTAMHQVYKVFHPAGRRGEPLPKELRELIAASDAAAPAEQSFKVATQGEADEREQTRVLRLILAQLGQLGAQQATRDNKLERALMRLGAEADARDRRLEAALEKISASVDGLRTALLAPVELETGPGGKKRAVRVGK